MKFVKNSILVKFRKFLKTKNFENFQNIDVKIVNISYQNVWYFPVLQRAFWFVDRFEVV
jgi:hypothetical protein